MSRLVRLFLVAAVAAAVLAPAAAYAGCSSDPTAPGCLPTPEPGTPAPPKTPTPSAKPSATPGPKTPTPTTHYVPPPVYNPVTTPEPTAFPVEVTSASPAATTVIETQPLTGDQSSNLQAQDAGQASSWIFGFIVGLLIGLLIGRASWGIKRRRRQQIFG